MPTYVRTQEIDHEIGSGGQFALRVTSPDVEMHAIDGNQAHVRATFQIRAASDAKADEIFDRVRLHVTEHPGSLEVTEPRDGPGGLGSLMHLLAGSGRVDTEVAVDAPRGCDLRYDGVSADVTATGFRGSQQYRTVSGDLVLEDVGGALRVKGVSSDISLRASETLPSLEINTVSGDVSAVAPAVGQLSVVTVSGDIELETSLADGPGHRVETVSGDFSLGLSGGLTVEVRGLSTDVDVRLPHRAEGSRDRRRYVIGDGGPDLLFSSMSGDIEVRTPHRGAPIPPAPPVAPKPPTPRSVDGQEQLDVLRALERGEIDVDQAARRLAGDV
jgi:putative adhesin